MPRIRRSPRLKGYEYSQGGAYYITINSQNNQHYFGAIENGEMLLNMAGEMVAEEWERLPARYLGLSLDAYIIMPNHFHAVLVMENNINSLSAIIGAFKSITTNRYIQGVKIQSWKPFEKQLWQGRFYDHIVRNESDLERIREYIQANPLRWDKNSTEI